MRLNKILKYIKHPKFVLLHLEYLGALNWLSDKSFLKLMFRLHLGYTLNLKNPQTFNEKIQWLKLNDRDARYTKIVDKYEVKKFVHDVLGSKYLIPTLGVWDTFEEIPLDTFPKQFVIKCTHDSGGVVICKDLAKFNIKNARKKINNSLKKNYYYHGREWPYKNVKPRILAEQYLIDESGYELKDYKIFAFSGEPKYIQVDFDRFTNHHRNFYDTTWNYVPFTTCYPTDTAHQVEKPQCLTEMLECTKKLLNALDKPAFMRVDFYIIGKKMIFGELTCYHGSGFEKFYPESYDLLFGKDIQIK